ncbi:hypothetical protein ACFU8Q_06620 [Streptomyces sp. NPDC057543]|uniref:hypothetical protein n=1 Tax=Streptomyces sp. NPDC057543 TaxID=3346163 RepID=UPI0036CDFA4D
MRPQRGVRCRTAAALGVVVGAALSAGCGVGGGLRSTGPAPNAVGPARLQPELPPASAAPYDYGEGETAHIPGIEAPHDDVHRVYMPEGGGPTRILSTADAVISVEPAGRDLILRVPSAITGCEYRTAWSWDDRRRAMLPTQDEILRIPPTRTAQPRPTATRPAATPSARVSAERR